MVDALRVWWRTLKHIHHNGYLYIWATLCTVVMSLPLVTAPAAWAALVHLSHAAQTRRDTTLNLFWQTFREQFWRGLTMGVLNLIVVYINLVNFIAHQGETGIGINAMRLVWLSSLIIWFSLQLYLWPLLAEMREPSLFGAMRNALIMVLANPGFTLVLWIGILIVVAISTVLTAMWLLITPGLLAILCSVAVLDRLRKSGYANPEHQLSPEESAGVLLS